MANANQKPGRTSSADRAESLSAGTTKHFPNASQELTVGGANLSVTQVTGNLKQIATLRSDTTAAQTAARAKVATEKAQLPQLLLFMSAYVAFIRGTFGNQPDVLADFGLPPKKTRAPLTVEQKAAAKAKREATRKARGTVGPVAKLAITGNVTGVTVTPLVAPPSVPAAPPATTPSTPSTGASGGAGNTPGSATGGAPPAHS
ncbi:MAG TPA: hypothetical protein VIF09_02180 [Polyangiaceae bacterium]